jgi:hypothetical protein
MAALAAVGFLALLAVAGADTDAADGNAVIADGRRSRRNLQFPFP